MPRSGPDQRGHAAAPASLDAAAVQGIQVSKLAVVWLVVTGLLVLAGYALRLPLLVRVAPGLPAMAPVSAAGLIVAGIALWLRLPDRAAAAQRVGQGLGLLLAGFGAVVLAEHLTGWRLGLDGDALAGSLAPMGWDSPSRPVPHTAVAFLLAGLALALLDADRRGGHRPAQLLVTLSATWALTALLGHLYRVPHLVSLSADTAIALNTAVALVALNAGLLLARPERGVVRAFTAPGPGGLLARRLLPAALLAPPLAGLLADVGQRIGWYETTFRLALTVMATMAALLATVSLTVRTVDRAEAARLESEQQLQVVQERYRLLARNLPNGAVFLFDHDLRYLLVDGAGLADVGLSRELLEGKTIWETLPPETCAMIEPLYRAALAGRPSEQDLPFGDHLYRVHLLPVYDRDGQVEVGMVFTQDVTGQRQATKALRASEEKFRGLLEGAPDAIVIVDPAGKIELVNQQTERLFGYRRGELVGQPVETLVPERFRARHRQHRSRYLASPTARPMGVDLQLYGRRKDASEFPVEISLSPLETDQGTLVSAAVRDITARKQAEAALEHARRAAEEANQAKSEYLSRMSHELRTPLNAILGFAQLLELESPRDDQLESLHHIAAGGRHLLQLINEVLDVAAVESGRLPLSLEPIDVADIGAEAVSLLRPLADQHGILLAEQPPADHVHVLGDRQRLKQVLLNLLSNAVKYNHDGGSVRLAYQRVPGAERLRISVTDTGPGIPPELVERLFVPFDRLGSERTTIEGTGLGLPLSKRLAEAMGGTLGVASTPGQGSSFWVELPLTGPPARHAERGRRLPGQEQPAPEPPPLTVLYIEDNLSNLQLVEHVLSRQPGVTLITAMRSQLGLDLATQHHPDLVLLDLDLPDLPGEAVLRRLRADRATADVPVAILSANAQPSLIIRLLEDGAMAFLTKPIDLRELLGLLDTVRGGRQQAGSSPAGF